MSNIPTLNHDFEHRNTCLELQVVNQMEGAAVQHQGEMATDGGLKKFTPRRKQLARSGRASKEESSKEGEEMKLVLMVITCSSFGE